MESRLLETRWETMLTESSSYRTRISTPMTGQEDVDPATQERPGIPLGRPGHAREIAEAVVFLAGPGASYATGSSFIIDGGLLLMAAVRNQE